jgi:antitoxin (DNA-binding transcriptional repressor) of toxin-antitoxin stability system
MKAVSIRDLHTTAAMLRKRLEDEGALVVTTNGTPFALMVPVHPEKLEEELQALRQAQFLRTLDDVGAQSKAAGTDGMSMDEIDELIADIRARRQASS